MLTTRHRAVNGRCWRCRKSTGSDRKRGRLM